MNYLYRLHIRSKNPAKWHDCKSVPANAKSMDQALYAAREINSLLTEEFVFRVEEIASGETEEL